MSRIRPLCLSVVFGLLSLFAWAGMAIAAEQCEIGSRGCMPAGAHAAVHGEFHHGLEACATQLAASPYATAAAGSHCAPSVGTPPSIVALKLATPAIAPFRPARGEGMRGLPSPLAATGRLRI